MGQTRYIIEMQCIDEGNEWGLKYGQKVYYNETCQFTLSPLDAMMSRSKVVLKDIIEKLIDEGNFMPTVKILRYIVE